MHGRIQFRHVLAIVGTAATLSCGGNGLPTSPSQLPAPNSATPSLDAGVIGAGSSTSGPSDYHEVPVPPPDPVPAPAPTAITISIVGSAGSGAFSPNPLDAALDNMIVWTNNDATAHRIVLDDGTVIGTISPGESSTPVPMATAAMNYHCTFHPSMVGTIRDPAGATPGPTPTPAPAPEPPPDDGYGYY